MDTDQFGKFIRWGQSVTIDQAKRLLRVLPIAQDENVVEFDEERTPTDEELDLRITSF